MGDARLEVGRGRLPEDLFLVVEENDPELGPDDGEGRDQVTDLAKVFVFARLAAREVVAANGDVAEQFADPIKEHCQVGTARS